MKKSMLLFLMVMGITSGAMAQSLNKLWATDTTLKVPESVLLDSKNQRLYVTNIDGKGPWDKELAKKLFDNVLSIGNTVDPADSYRSFRGRDPQIDALMRKRGFSSAADASMK